MNKQLGLDIHDEIIVDNFAGGGGASTGIELATGRRVDVAINHDPDAIAMHTANHPETRHYCDSVWEVDPRAVEPGRPIGLLCAMVAHPRLVAYWRGANVELSGLSAAGREGRARP